MEEREKDSLSCIIAFRLFLTCCGRKSKVASESESTVKQNPDFPSPLLLPPGRKKKAKSATGTRKNRDSEEDREKQKDRGREEKHSTVVIVYYVMPNGRQRPAKS